MTRQEEQRIIEQVGSGNGAAFAALVRAHSDSAVSIAYGILLNKEDAEEAAQDAFLRAYGRLPTFRGEARFSTWLYRIVVTTSLNRRRLVRPRTVPVEGASALPATSAFPPCSTQRKIIDTALATLPLKERLCLTLFYLQECSVEEVSEASGLTPAHVKVLLHRGRKGMYAALKRDLKDELTQLY